MNNKQTCAHTDTSFPFLLSVQRTEPDREDPGRNCNVGSHDFVPWLLCEMSPCHFEPSGPHTYAEYICELLLLIKQPLKFCT